MMAIFPVLFVIGYAMIALEHPLKINKSASALVLGSFLWLLWFIISGDTVKTSEELALSLESVSSIIFFLMGAMAIVAVVDSYDGFDIITSRIKTNNLRTLLWIISWITFFMSAVLDNMTTSIVMVTLTQKLLSKPKDRKFFAGMIIIAANAGGAASPIGDVTTTMLWIGGQISATGIIERVGISSIMNMLIPLLLVTRILKGPVRSIAEQKELEQKKASHLDRDLVFLSGIGGLVLVPIYRTIFGIPPYIGMLLSLGFLWFLTEILLHKKDSETVHHFSISSLLTKVDLPSILFFTGILFAVGVLEANGQLGALASMLQNKINNLPIIVMAIGILSSIVDNVPLVAGTMGMYNLSTYPMDSLLWEFTAYCAGTGGSILIIGSAAGVATMGIEKISFGWYLRRIAPLALLGFFAGAGTYLLMRTFL